MWRAIRFGGMFKGNRFVTEKDVDNKIKKIDEHFGEQVVEDRLILSSAFNGVYDSKLAGLLLVKYNDEYDTRMVQVFREIGIYTHEKISDRQVDAFKNAFDKKKEEFAEASFISVGDVVLYSDIECIVSKIDGENATIILNIFGVNTETSVSLKELTKKMN